MLAVYSAATLVTGMKAALALPQSIQNFSPGDAAVLMNRNIGGKVTATIGTGTGAQTFTNSADTAVTTGGVIGTFTYSASAGNSNNFAVGTSSQLGVNASASSTQDYGVSSNATLKADTSKLTQSIGTSGINDTQAASSVMNMNQASTTVQDKMGTTYSDLATKSGWTAANGGYSNASVNSGAVVTAANYNDQKNTLYTSTVTSLNSASSQSMSDAKNGIISGSFSQTANDGTTVTGTTGGLTTVAQTVASTSSNNVTVAGVGNAATINATSGSQFASTVAVRNTAATAGLSNSATASGSAGASLNSSATANSSATGFASTFIQSF